MANLRHADTTFFDPSFYFLLLICLFFCMSMSHNSSFFSYLFRLCLSLIDYFIWIMFVFLCAFQCFLISLPTPFKVQYIILTIISYLFLFFSFCLSPVFLFLFSFSCLFTPNVVSEQSSFTNINVKIKYI